MTRFSRIVKVVLALLVLSSALGAPAFAQSADPGNETGNETEPVGPVGPGADNASSNASSNESGNESGGPGNWVSGGSGVVPSISNPVPSPGEMITSAFEWVQDGAVDIIELILEASIEVVIGTPQPGNDGWVGTFGEPTNEPYDSLFDSMYEGKILPFTLALLLGSLLIIGGIMPYTDLIGSYRVHMWIVRIVVAIFAVALAWPLSSLMHQLANDIAYTFAPETEEIITLTGALSLGSSAAPVAATFYLIGWFKVAIYAFIYFFRYQLLFWLPFAFPVLLVMALAGPHKKLRSFGSFAIWQYVGLLIMPIPNAMMFGGAYALDWSFGASGLANVGLVFGMFLTGILLPIGIMYAFAQGPGMITGLVAGTASSAAQGVQRRSDKGWKPDSAERARDLSQTARTQAASTFGSVRSRLSSADGDSSKAATDGGSTSSGSSSSADSSSESSSGEIKEKYGSDSDHGVGTHEPKPLIQRRERERNRGGDQDNE